MKHSKTITNLIKLGALLLATGSTHPLGAFTYTNSNVLLVFRGDTGTPFNDVEFNLGSVSNFLGLASGTTIPVTNWNVTLVSNNFSHNLALAKFLVVAVTEANDSTKRVWLTDANQSDIPTDITSSKWSQLYSKISYFAGQAAAATLTNVSSQVYVTNANDASSYTYTALSGGDLTQDASTLSGTSRFPIESFFPATNRFIQLKTSSLTPKPAATVVGTFTMSSIGVLTFTAGSQAVLSASHIASINRAGSVNSITFTTASGANYRLRYTTDLIPNNGSNWVILPGSVAGDGANKTLSDTTAVAQRFYAVEAYH